MTQYSADIEFGLTLQKGNIDIVDILLRHPQIDVNNENKRNRKTALFISSEEGHPDIVRMLLRNPQINVMILDSYGESALQKAALMGHLRVVKLLLRCSMTMTSVPTEVKYMDVREAIEKRATLLQIGATCCLDVRDSLLNASWHGDFRAIRGTLQCPSSDVNVRNVKGRTPSYLSSLRGHIRSMQELLKSPHIDPNKGMESDGSSAFSIASEKGHFQIMRELLQHNKTGWSID